MNSFCVCEGGGGGGGGLVIVFSLNCLLSILLSL